MIILPSDDIYDDERCGFHAIKQYGQLSSPKQDGFIGQNAMQINRLTTSNKLTAQYFESPGFLFTTRCFEMKLNKEIVKLILDHNRRQKS